MRLSKRTLKCGGIEIICHIGKNEWANVWSAPPDSVDHAGHDYLENRYKCLTTKKRVAKFKQLYKELMKCNALTLIKSGRAMGISTDKLWASKEILEENRLLRTMFKEVCLDLSSDNMCPLVSTGYILSECEVCPTNTPYPKPHQSDEKRIACWARMFEEKAAVKIDAEDSSEKSRYKKLTKE